MSTMKVVAWLISSNRSKFARATESTDVAARAQKHPFAIVSPLVRESDALAAIKAVRIQALEEAALICDEQQLDGECPERASYCADAIRCLGAES